LGDFDVIVLKRGILVVSKKVADQSGDDTAVGVDFPRDSSETLQTLCSSTDPVVRSHSNQDFTPVLRFSAIRALPKICSLTREYARSLK
jgi:hypothetical protein